MKILPSTSLTVSTASLLETVEVRIHGLAGGVEPFEQLEWGLAVRKAKEVSNG